MKLSVHRSAFAKINLYLDVTGVHPSGKHLIQSVMHRVSLCDRVTVSPLEPGEICIICSGEFSPGIPADERNIAYRCAAEFFRVTGIDSGVCIDIEKNIPSGAGLGGGSADGASVLLGLNTLFEAGLSREALCSMGARIGADIPFCIMGGCAHCTGVGEVMEALPRLSGCIVIAKGESGISTKEAYRLIDGLGMGSFRERIRENFSRGGDVMEALGEAGCYNIFERVTDTPDVFRIKRIMLENGAGAAMMTGSGSAVFGVFDGVSAGERAADLLSCMGFWSGVYMLLPDFEV